MNIRVRKCGGPLGLCTEQCVGGSASASWKECCCNQVDSEGDAEHCSVAGADVSFHSFVVSLCFFLFLLYLGSWAVFLSEPCNVRMRATVVCVPVRRNHPKLEMDPRLRAFFSVFFLTRQTDARLDWITLSTVSSCF